MSEKNELKQTDFFTELSKPEEKAVSTSPRKGLSIQKISDDLGVRRADEVNKSYDHLFRDFRDIEDNPRRKSRKKWAVDNKFAFNPQEKKDFNISVLFELRNILEIEQKKITKDSDEEKRVLQVLDDFRASHPDLPIRTIQNELRYQTGTDFKWPRLKPKKPLTPAV